jgi:hypothetical protein
MQIGSAGEAVDQERSVVSAEEKLNDRLNQLVSSLQSQDCTIRARAILQQLPYLKSAPKEVFRKQNKNLTPEVRLKLDSIVAMLEQKERLANEFERLTKTHVSSALRENDPERSRLLAKAKNTLLAIANSPKESFPKRLAAVGAMGFFVDQFDDPEGEMRRMGLPLEEWKRDVIGLLDSNDSRLRSIVASSSTASDVPRRKIIPILLNALREDDLMIRVSAQNALMKRTGQNFCIDPTDPFERRESGIHQWEQWWALTKEK